MDQIVDSGLLDFAGWAGLTSAAIMSYRLVSKANNSSKQEYLDQTEFLKRQLDLRGEMLAEVQIEVRVLRAEIRLKDEAISDLNMRLKALEKES